MLLAASHGTLYESTEISGMIIRSMQTGNGILPSEKSEGYLVK